MSARLTQVAFLLAVAAFVALLLAGCGGGGDDADDAAQTDQRRPTPSVDCKTNSKACQ